MNASKNDPIITTVGSVKVSRGTPMCFGRGSGSLEFVEEEHSDLSRLKLDSFNLKFSRVFKTSTARLRIAVDLDGVLAESMLVWCKLVNKEFGLKVKIEDLDSWASWKHFSISKDDFYRILDESWENWGHIPATEPRIAEKVARLERFGDVDVVTGRSRKTLDAAMNWVESHKIRYRRFVRVEGWRDKAILDYDVYVDDAPDLMPLISKIPLRWAVLYDRPWNRNVAAMPKVVRVEKWTEIPRIMGRVQKQLA